MGTAYDFQQAYRLFIDIPAGELAHSGDGVGGLAVRGELQGGPLDLSFACDELQFGHRIEPGDFEFVMPVIAQRTTAQSIWVFGRAEVAAQLRIDEVALVHQPGGDGVVSLVPSATGAGIQLLPPQPVRLGRRPALLIQTEPGGAIMAGLEILIRTEDAAAVRKVSFDLLNPGGDILLDLGPETGLRVSAVELRCKSSAVTVRSAMITGAE